jgi:hypothetical protein
MPQAFLITGRVEFSGDANLLSGGRVEAYVHLWCSKAVHDLPSLEQRGRAPQLLGQSPIDDKTPYFTSNLLKILLSLEPKQAISRFF